MKLWPLISFVIFFLFTWIESGIDAADEITKSKIVNASSKLDFGVGSPNVGFNPNVYGQTYDEIVVQSSLNIRPKNPTTGARKQRTQLFPVKSNATDSKTNSKSGTSNANVKS